MIAKFLCFFILLIQTIVFSQESVASITKKIEICQLDSTGFWLKKQALIVKDSKSQKENIINYIDYFLKTRSFDSATLFLNNFKKIIEINSDSALYYYYKGRINHYNRNFRKAEEDFFVAIKIAKNDSLTIGKIYNALFITYYNLNNQDSTFIFKVTDTGVGIDEARIPQLFRLFSSLKTEHHVNKTGIGLGLTVCKLLTTKLGGEIKITSKINRGSEFIVRIPIQTRDKQISDDQISEEII